MGNRFTILSVAKALSGVAVLIASIYVIVFFTYVFGG